MAKKGQKFKTYTSEEREKIVAEIHNGKANMYSAGKKYEISPKTIESWLRKYRRQKNLNQLTKGRRKTANVTELDKLRLENEILKKFQAFLKVQQERK